MIGQYRDFQLAEEALQDAWLVAAEKWPVDGWPDNPPAWVFTVASRKALDTHPPRTEPRRPPTGRHSDELERRELDDLDRREERWHSGVDDERLRLVFTCCHPSLDLEARIALTLRSVAWLTTDEIADAFGVPTATMAQRIVRAKAKIKSAGMPYRVPVGHELPGRLAGVLRVVYLVFNEAYLSRRPDEPVRVDLAEEAIRLGRELADLMPDEPEVGGLLALMLVQHAALGRPVRRRRRARPARTAGSSPLGRCGHRRGVGPARTVDAAHDRSARFSSKRRSQHCTVEATSFEETDWAQIAALYGCSVRSIRARWSH